MHQNIKQNRPKTKRKDARLNYTFLDGKQSIFFAFLPSSLQVFHSFYSDCDGVFAFEYVNRAQHWDWKTPERLESALRDKKKTLPTQILLNCRQNEGKGIWVFIWAATSDGKGLKNGFDTSPALVSTWFYSYADITLKSNKKVWSVPNHLYVGLCVKTVN